MDLNQFLEQCSQAGLTVIPWENIVLRAGEAEMEEGEELENQADQNQVSASSSQSAVASAPPPPAVGQNVWKRTAGSILNEFCQRSGLYLEQKTVDVRPDRFKHEVKLDKYTASHIASSKKVAMNIAKSKLLCAIPWDILQNYLPENDLLYISQEICYHTTA